MNLFEGAGLLATGTIWLRPVVPLVAGMLAAMGLLWGTRRLAQLAPRLGTGGTLVAFQVFYGAVLAVVAVLYLALDIHIELNFAVGGAVAVLTFPALYGLLRLVLPRAAAVALATTKEAVWQPLFWVAVVIGLVAMLFFPFIPYHTFGEDIKMLKDSGLTLVMILAILVALWTASVSITAEVEGRTALTVLSKPVRRRDFILGKFFGICGAVGWMFVILGAAFLISVSYKVPYDAVEFGSTIPPWTESAREMVQVVPGLVLAFFETCVLTSISVAISTRLPMLANQIICWSIYVIGHIIPMLVESSLGSNAIVQFVGRLFAAIFPMLVNFNIQAAVSAGREVPLWYVAVAFVYGLLYCTVALLASLILFEDRDLA